MTPRRIRVVGVLAALGVLVAAWFALVSPQRSKAAALDVEAASQHAASDQLEARISLLKKMSEELPAQEAKLASIQQRMPKTVALPTLIRNLSKVAKESNVAVASVTPGRPVPIVVEVPAVVDAPAAAESSTEDTPAVPEESTVEAVSLSISACGTFAQLRTYLGNLESMKRVLAVHGLSIAPGACTPGSSEDDLTASITANVFTLPDADPAGATTSEGASDE